jgi:hypothetical protein
MDVKRVATHARYSTKNVCPPHNASKRCLNQIALQHGTVFQLLCGFTALVNDTIAVTAQ